jgi:polysaccharide biosynthesis/export protein
MKLTTLLSLALLAALPAASAQEVRRAVAANPPAAADNSYQLRPGDQIEIRVFRHDDLSVRGPVSADGTVAMQFINSVNLAGLTPAQASSRIQALYADGWLKKPQVSVNVLEYARATFTVTGAVNRANTFNLPRNRPLTLLEAIGAAGHFKNTANQKSVLIKRAGKTYTVNVKDILKNPAKDVVIRDGDLIWVREAAF